MRLKNVNTKSYIANKINIIAKAPVRYSYGSFARANRAKLIHNTRQGARTLWALTIRPKIPERISGNFLGQMVQSFSSMEDDNCSLGIFQ